MLPRTVGMWGGGVVKRMDGARTSGRAAGVLVGICVSGYLVWYFAVVATERVTVGYNTALAWLRERKRGKLDMTAALQMRRNQHGRDAVSMLCNVGTSK